MNSDEIPTTRNVQFKKVIAPSKQSKLEVNTISQSICDFIKISFSLRLVRLTLRHSTELSRVIKKWVAVKLIEKFLFFSLVGSIIIKYTLILRQLSDKSGTYIDWKANRIFKERTIFSIAHDPRSPLKIESDPGYWLQSNDSPQKRFQKIFFWSSKNLIQIYIFQGTHSISNAYYTLVIKFVCMSDVAKQELRINV